MMQSREHEGARHGKESSFEVFLKPGDGPLKNTAHFPPDKNRSDQESLLILRNESFKSLNQSEISAEKSNISADYGMYVKKDPYT